LYHMVEAHWAAFGIGYTQEGQKVLNGGMLLLDRHVKSIYLEAHEARSTQHEACLQQG